MVHNKEVKIICRVNQVHMVTRPSNYTPHAAAALILVILQWKSMYNTLQSLMHFQKNPHVEKSPGLHEYLSHT